MKVGDLVRNIHTVRGSDADEHGIVVEQAKKGFRLVKVMWFPNGLVEYMTWMDIGDLEVLCK